MKNNRTFIPLCLFLFISTASANETQNLAGNDQNNSDSQVITIETATIRGNQELPTVLYLVPWQPPQINALAETQTTDLTEPNLELIERSSFRRLIKYYHFK